MAFLPALVAAATGVVLALHYPLMPPAAAAAFALAAAAFYVWPSAWLTAVPALLPLIGLAPWSGWIAVEELDLLVLAAAAGGYARLALRPAADPVPGTGRASALTGLVVALFALSTVVAMVRGVLDAGGFTGGWFQGYHEPLNSVRLAKPLLLALLLWPLWRHAAARAPEDAVTRLALGLALGLAGASLATVWERTAFTGLLNFSSDYRTTALFWEMHVGGAALDGFLAMTVPFVVFLLLSERRQLLWGVAAAVAALAGYASLTTFSRGVYLAVPIGVALTMGLYALQQRALARQMRAQAPAAAAAQAPGSLLHAIVPAAALLLGVALATSFMFRSSGYRGMLAVLGAVLLLLALPSVLPRLRAGQWLGGLLLGALGALLVTAFSWLVPKGAYLAYAASVAATAALLAYSLRTGGAARQQGSAGRQRLRFGQALVVAGFLATVAGVAAVAQHWGGVAGLTDALPVVGGLLLAAGIAAKPGQPAWPTTLRWQGMVLCGAAMVAATVGVFGGGAYMSGRFSTGERDFAGRIEHWRKGLSGLTTSADWLLGRGLGRFPSALFFGDAKDHPGDYRLVQDERNSHLSISAGNHVTGWGEILRVSQRVDVPALPAVVTADVRAERAVALHFEVCEKHLLYNANCLVRQVSVKAQPGEWQRVRVELQGPGPVGRGDWFAPKLLMFSMAMGSSGQRADLDNVALTDGRGRQLLANGDFSQGMARWFFSSDRHHMPWHIKSVLMNVLFDQGLLGLALWLTLGAAAMWRLCLGSARGHALAPPLAGALAGFLVVGLFDSLLDVPRVSFVFYLLLLLGLTVRPTRAARPASAIPQPAARGLGSGVRAIALAALGIGLLGAMQGDAWAAANTVQQQELRQGAGRWLQVGPTRSIRTLAQASRLARPGDTVAVDAGDYVGDVAVWTQDRLTLLARGGRVRLLANGAAAEGKGIWVVRANGVKVEGFDFEGSQVPSRNGAGIRLEKGSLHVRDCSFRFNEMGLLTGNDADSVLEVENSEFAYNARPDGHNHNLYVGQIARFSIQGSYLHHAHIGHLLKSRAAYNHVAYNRLSDEAGGTASYELEFPNGGLAFVIGNIIEQGAQTENPHIVSFGAEGYRWPVNALHLVHNTLVDGKPSGGIFVRVAPGNVRVQALNNLFVGAGQVGLDDSAHQAGNQRLRLEPADFDTRSFLRPSGTRTSAPLADPGMADGQDLRLLRSYAHPRGSQLLRAPPHEPGALQRPERLTH